MNNLNDVIMSEYTSKLLPQNFLHDTHMPPNKPIASAGCESAT